MKTMFKLSLGLVLVSLSFLLACGSPPSPSPAPPSKATPSQPARPTTAASIVTPAPTQPRPPQAEPKPKQPPAAASQDLYFKDKTISIIIPFPPGGGNDILARIVAPLFQNHIPGNPKVVVQNRPGASGANATNSFYVQAKPDGTTLLLPGSSQISMAMRQVETVKYDIKRFRFVGNLARAESVLLINRKSAARLTDPQANPVFVGCKEGEETWNAMTMWGKEFLGWNIKWIPGFEGTKEVELAFRRGEVDMMATQSATVLRPLIDEGLAQPLTQAGIYKGGKFLRRPDFADLPTFFEVLGDKRPTGMAWQAYMAWVGPSMIDKSLLAPPETPDNVMAILTRAWERVSQDPKFDELVRKMLGEPYDVGIGVDTENVVKELMTTPPEALKYGVDLQRKFVTK